MTELHPGDGHPTTAIIRGPADAVARVILDTCLPPADRDGSPDRDDDSTAPEHEPDPC